VPADCRPETIAVVSLLFSVMSPDSRYELCSSQHHYQLSVTRLLLQLMLRQRHYCLQSVAVFTGYLVTKEQMLDRSL